MSTEYKIKQNIIKMMPSLVVSNEIDDGLRKPETNNKQRRQGRRQQQRNKNRKWVPCPAPASLGSVKVASSTTTTATTKKASSTPATVPPLSPISDSESERSLQSLSSTSTSSLSDSSSSSSKNEDDHHENLVKVSSKVLHAEKGDATSKSDKGR